MCDYLADVLRNRQQDSKNSAVFVGAGVLGGISWFDRKIIKKSQKIEFSIDYPWGEVVRRIALAAAKSGTQVIVEVPPEAQVADTKQYRLLSNKELWRHNVIDGCSHGQRLLVPGHEGQSCVKYCSKKWEFFSANTALEQKPSDVCKAKHNHACWRDYLVEGSKEVRTSQISKRLPKSLSFKEGDGRLVSMPVTVPKNKPNGVIVELGHDGLVNKEGSDRHTCMFAC